jgi:mRNA interferase MazF
MPTHSRLPEPSRGEIWTVRFDPQIGAETKKDRPAVVISLPSMGKLPLRIVTPITEWDPRYAGYPWMVELKPTKMNGLTKDSAADCFQVKSVSVERFLIKRGQLTSAELNSIAASIALVVGFSMEC